MNRTELEGEIAVILKDATEDNPIGCGEIARRLNLFSFDRISPQRVGVILSGLAFPERYDDNSLNKPSPDILSGKWKGKVGCVESERGRKYWWIT